VEKDNFEVNNNLGKVYGLKKDYTRAVEHFARAVSKNPKDITVRENLATAYTSAGLLEKASEAYEAIVKMDSTNWDARYELGKLYIQLGNKTGAKEVLENLIRTKSDYEKAAEVKRLINTLE
jgi:Flp pilus assembly protein TadD